jgi:outer membrane protein assembly factor BamA
MSMRFRNSLPYAVLAWAALLFIADDLYSRPPETVESPEQRPQLEAAPLQSETGRADFKIVFRGVRSFEESVLQEAIKEQIKGIQDYGLNPARANDTAFFLALFYLKQGYSQVQVTEQISGSRLVLNVREGPLTKLGETTFTGNTAFDSETLRSYLIGATRERASRFKAEEDLPFVETDIKTGASRIKSLYLSEGYLDLEIAKPEFDYSTGYKEASVTLHITQGTKYTIGKPAIRGHLNIFEDKKGDRIEKLTSQYVGKPFTSQKIVNLRRSIV